MTTPFQRLRRGNTRGGRGREGYATLVVTLPRERRGVELNRNEKTTFKSDYEAAQLSARVNPSNPGIEIDQFLAD